MGDLLDANGASSSEDFDDEGANEPNEHHGDGSAVADGAVDASGQPQKTPLPMQKRRRVTRACDECRRKKIKCDGKQPCTHCTVYSYGQCLQAHIVRGMSGGSPC